MRNVFVIYTHEKSVISPTINAVKGNIGGQKCAEQTRRSEIVQGDIVDILENN